MKWPSKLWTHRGQPLFFEKFLHSQIHKQFLSKYWWIKTQMKKAARSKLLWTKTGLMLRLRIWMLFCLLVWGTSSYKKYSIFHKTSPQNICMNNCGFFLISSTYSHLKNVFALFPSVCLHFLFYVVLFFSFLTSFLVFYCFYIRLVILLLFKVVILYVVYINLFSIKNIQVNTPSDLHLNTYTQTHYLL